MGGWSHGNNATSITYDDIIYLEHSIDASYRTDCEFMCHDNIVRRYVCWKDSNGRYLWTYGVDAGQPDTLDGKRLTVNQDMAGDGQQCQTPASTAS